MSRFPIDLHGTPVTTVSQPDDLSFDRLALPWLDDVCRFAHSLARDASDADDLVQETYLRAYRSWASYRPDRPDGDARRWLFTICRHVFLRTRERSARESTLTEEDVATVAAGWVGSAASAGTMPDPSASSGPIGDPATEALITRLDLVPALRCAVAALPDAYRAAVVLVDVEDQSYDAAAEVLGVPVGTVRSRLFRGRRLLQGMLIEQARDAGLVPPAARHADRERVNDAG